MNAIRNSARVALLIAGILAPDIGESTRFMLWHEFSSAPIVPRAGRAYAASLGETVTVAADQPIPNIPGKRLVSLIVNYPPGASSPPHHHARSAFIYAYVLSGEVRSQVDDGPIRVYRSGESWFENPGAHHSISANASETVPARLLAVFIVDTGNEQLTSQDPR